MYVDVLLEINNKEIDKTFTYKVPNNLKKDIKVGKRVLVPFNNRKLEGFILNVRKEIDASFNVLDICSIIDDDAILNDELLEIGKYIKDTCLCSLSISYQTLLPKALKASVKTNIKKKYQTNLVLNVDYDKAINMCTSKLQKEIINLIYECDKIDIKEAYLCSKSSVNTLLKKEIIKEEKEEVYRLKNKIYEQDPRKELTIEQKNALNIITKSLKKEDKFLLYGVTGSGKTEVYIRVIEKVLSLNKTALVLVPEISLTPQFVEQFQKVFPNQVAVLHSHLSDGERFDEWRKISREEVSIVIGTRSSIFAPLKNLGVIIVDEEHSDSYKQENTPRYNAIDIAEFRSNYNKCPLILGSATPSLERMAKSTKNIYKRIELKKRISNNYPMCTIVNMASEIKKGNAILSKRLKDEIESSISRDEQVILLLNRRGFSTTITCSNCGFTYKCPHCDITLTYHKSKNNLRCHYCGYTIIKQDKCPSCKEELNYYGLGTEKLEEIIKLEFPDFKVLRMDKDTTRTKNSYEKILNKFRSGEYDILLGTQMISKGLDFPKVSLVGIINADATLNIPDFRSGEKTFSLLYQASGRAGRKDTLGNVIIQTFNPDNPVLKCVTNQSYEKFYNYEMGIRKKLKYPPYYYLVSLKVTSKDYDLCSKEAIKTCNYLKNSLEKETIVLGPTTANVFKVNNIYRFNIIIKYRFDKKLIPTLKELDKIFLLNKKVNLEIDLNPIKID